MTQPAATNEPRSTQPNHRAGQTPPEALPPEVSSLLERAEREAFRRRFLVRLARLGQRFVWLAAALGLLVLFLPVLGVVEGSAWHSVAVPAAAAGLLALTSGVIAYALWRTWRRQPDRLTVAKRVDQTCGLHGMLLTVVARSLGPPRKPAPSPHEQQQPSEKPSGSAFSEDAFLALVERSVRAETSREREWPTFGPPMNPWSHGWYAVVALIAVLLVVALIVSGPLSLGPWKPRDDTHALGDELRADEQERPEDDEPDPQDDEASRPEDLLEEEKEEEEEPERDDGEESEGRDEQDGEADDEEEDAVGGEDDGDGSSDDEEGAGGEDESDSDTGEEDDGDDGQEEEEEPQDTDAPADAEQQLPQPAPDDEADEEDEEPGEADPEEETEESEPQEPEESEPAEQDEHTEEDQEERDEQQAPPELPEIPEEETSEEQGQEPPLPLPQELDPHELEVEPEDGETREGELDAYGFDPEGEVGEESVPLSELLTRTGPAGIAGQLARAMNTRDAELVEAYYRKLREMMREQETSPPATD